MAESSILNNAARIIKVVQAGTPADQALRESLTLTQNRHYTAPGERRGISRAVFTYYRWWRWLSENESLQKQLETALALQERFNKNADNIKAPALASRAVPDWLKAEMEVIPSAWLQQLQREPTLWIRTKQDLGPKIAATLGNTTPANLGSTLALPTAFSYSGPRLPTRQPRRRPKTG
jgi:16S rRNA (cytosine967-C5)-methyltransferase